GGRPVVGAARDRRAYRAYGLVDAHIRGLGVDLDVLGGIVLERLAGLRIDARGPGHALDVLSCFEELAVEPIEDVLEAVATGMRQDLAVLAVHLGVDDDVAASLVVVTVIVRRVLVVPPDLAVCGVERDRTRGVEIVAKPIGRIVGWHRIARSPIREIGGGIVGPGNVEGAAAGLPRIVVLRSRCRARRGPGSSTSPTRCRRSWHQARRPSCAGRDRRPNHRYMVSFKASGAAVSSRSA